MGFVRAAKPRGAAETDPLSVRRGREGQPERETPADWLFDYALGGGMESRARKSITSILVTIPTT